MKEIIGRQSRMLALCESCFWTVSVLDKRKCESTLCPSCHKKSVVLIPLAGNESFVYSFSDKRGLELSFASSK